MEGFVARLHAAEMKLKQETETLAERVSQLRTKMLRNEGNTRRIVAELLAAAQRDLKQQLRELEAKRNDLTETEQSLNERAAADAQFLQSAFEERFSGLPWLANAFAEYLELRDLRTSDFLERKTRPAPRAAEEVRRLAADRRRSEQAYRVLHYLLTYYEALFPWLTEFRGEDVDELLRSTLSGRVGAEADEADAAQRFLTEEEYRDLPVAQRYQLALDRYWRKEKTKWEIGRDYERYVGYLFEKRGYAVTYHGILEGFDDLGRDLVASQDEEIRIVQCKCWSRDKLIHEKHVFQLFGTVVSFRLDNPDRPVFGEFVTSTYLTDRALGFANQLGISVTQGLPLELYPCVKCNVSRENGERIFHLPFDQQYDTTVVESGRGERYVATVQEAMAVGFRRARRWQGKK